MSRDYEAEERQLIARIIVIALVVVFLVIGLIVAGTHIKRIEPGHVGIRIDYAKGSHNQPYISEVGVGYHLQWIRQRIVEYPIAQQTLTMVRQEKEGKITGDDSVACQDQNGVPINIDVSVLWRVNAAEAGQLFLLRPNASTQQIEDQIVRRDARNAITIACSEFSYTDIYGAKRGDFQGRAADVLQSSLATSHLTMDNLIVGETHLQQAQQDAITAVANAQQKVNESALNVQTAKNNADAAVADAEGKKQAAIKDAEGKAASIDIIESQLSKSPLYLNYLTITEWNGQLPYYMNGGSDGLFQFILPEPKG